MLNQKFRAHVGFGSRLLEQWYIKALSITFALLVLATIYLWIELNNQAQKFSTADSIAKLKELDSSVFTYDFLLASQKLEAAALKFNTGAISKNEFQSVLDQVKSCFANFDPATPISTALRVNKSFEPAYTAAQGEIALADVYSGRAKELRELSQSIRTTSDLWNVLRTDAYGRENRQRHQTLAFLSETAEHNEMINSQLWKISIFSLLLLGATISLFFFLFKENIRHRKIVDQIISTLSHDLRSPLHVIGNTAPMLVDPMNAVKRSQHLLAIRVAVEKMGRLIEDIFVVSRGDSLALNLQYELLNNWFFQLTNFHANQASNNGLTFEFDLVTDFDFVLMDAHRVNQAIGNVIENAIKYTDVGSVKFALNAKKISDEVCELKFEILDTGSGIEETDLKEIFLPYVRTKSATEKRGLGLGLAIFKNLAESFGAKYEVLSRVGKGTRFTVSFQTKARNALVQYDESVAEDWSVADRDTKSDVLPKILVVDDDEAILVMTAETLTNVGYEVDTAPSGPQALEMAAKEAYQLVITDINMPLMDGFEFAEKVITTMGFRPFLVAISADNTLSSNPRAALFDVVLQKPIALKTLIEALEAFEES